MHKRLLIATLLWAACSDESPLPGNDAGWLDDAGRPADGGTSSEGGASASDAGADGSISEADSGPVLPYGLERRPANTTCVAPARPVIGNGVVLEDAFGPNVTFTQPVGIFQAPGDPSMLYVIEQGGAIKRVPNSKSAQAADVRTVYTQTVVPLSSIYDERGLLGLAFHPNFQSNGYVFINYVGTDGANGDTTFVDRLKVPTSNTAANWGTPERLNILKVRQPFTNHNGGNLAFDKHGHLFIGMGDGGSSGDPGQRAQNKSELLGKMLRIDVDRGTPYAIPDGNPFKSGGGRPEIYAWGLRNPWRWSFDRETGELWVGDVGQDCSEEIDIVEAGKNYGWDNMEGHYCYVGATCGRTNCSFPDHVPPVFDYMHPGKTGAQEPFTGSSITGGFVYRGTAIPGLAGTYIWGDYGDSNHVFGLRKKGAGYEPLVLLDPGGTVTSFGEDLAGELYAALYSGKIKKLVASATPASDSTPKTLRETGCFDASDPTKPLDALISYGINVPFWSDGASKERFVAIPDGTTLSVGADGDVELPPGGVAIKHFRLADKLVETRFYVRYADGSYGGYTYQWNDAQTDATLLQGPATKRWGDQDWYYPARGECDRCHTEAAKGHIGLELLQLDRAHRYGAVRADQLSTLSHIGFFASAPQRPAQALPASDDLAAPLEQRARAYLHANCSNCHRPGGPGRGMADLRFAGPLNVCNTEPLEGTLGVAGAKLLVPGRPDLSLIHLRMARRGDGAMPPLASTRVDEAGAQLIESWIAGLTGCAP